MRNAYRTAVCPTLLKRRIARQAACGGPIRILIGAGFQAQEGWIPTDMQYLNLLVEDHWKRALDNHPIDAIIAEHVWEHLSPTDGRAAAANCFKYLRPGGYLRVAVPDGNHPNPDYIDFVRVGGSGPGADDHKVLYTYESFGDLFRSVGFDVELLEYYDADHNFHANPWDPSAGRIHRCQGRTERKTDGGTVQYTSVILDARKPCVDRVNKR